MQYATMSLFLVLTACSAYAYDGRGNLVPYGGTTSTRSTAATSYASCLPAEAWLGSSRHGSDLRHGEPAA